MSPSTLTPLLEPDDINEQNRAALEGGVNTSGVEKLVQLEVHKCLHRAYESGDLRKTVLSHFLLSVAVDHHKLLKWVGSDLAPEGIAPINS